MLPLIQSMKNIEVDVSDDNMILSCSTAPFYKLSVKFTRSIQSVHAAAKFLKKKRVLKITCPVN